jgi:eukaryotic-like serine/threonine-protein kinase
MELWTEYEGTTIDGSFPLTKLLQPEGRSAFFSTPNGSGVPRIIRLIESHFDEEEILARWRGVAALNHSHLLKLEKFGRVELDGTSLVYAVMEPVDANLGEVVARQRLSAPETMQLASSVTSALNALHAHGFVHEHVEPGSVMAVGETVKLRSDCIREAPEGEEGRALKRRDVHDLGVLLLQALRQARIIETAMREPLPKPFDRIVPLAMDGQWGLAEIAAALGEKESIPAIVPPTALASDAEAASSPRPNVHSELRRAEAPGNETPLLAERIAPPAEDRSRADGRTSARPVVPAAAKLAGVVLVLILVVWVTWHATRGKSTHSVSSVPSKAGEAATPVPVATSVAPSRSTEPAPIRASSAQKSNTSTVGGQWRVIAYTYNRREQAEHKADVVGQKYPELQAKVFAPGGHAPYLVSVGGSMSRDEAFALVRKLRRQGLPHDTYAQNYSGAGD